MKIDSECQTENKYNNIESKIPCFDNTILFFYYYLQCIITIIIFSLYTPFKKDLSENKYLIFYFEHEHHLLKYDNFYFLLLN